MKRGNEAHEFSQSVSRITQIQMTIFQNGSTVYGYRLEMHMRPGIQNVQGGHSKLPSPGPQIKSFPSPKAVNTTTGPQFPKYVSAAFGSLDLPWKPGQGEPLESDS